MDTEIILNGQFKLDLTDDVNLLFTYQCGDIRTVLGRNSSYSKTISIKGTTNNNQAFSNLFDVRNYSDFNPNKKASVVVISGGIKIFEGYLKVDSIKISNTNLISYECSMYSNVSDLFTELANIKLNQLDFSEFNHTYTQSAVTDSWTSSIYYNGQVTPVRKGFGYVYPYVDMGNDGSLTNIKYTEFFKPCFYAKTILDKIFSQTDYSYKSSFLSSDYFKSLIVVPSANSFFLPDLIYNDTKVWASQEVGDSVDVTTILESISFGGSPTPSQNIGATKYQSLAPYIYNRGMFGTLELPNTTLGGRYDYGSNFNVTTWTYRVPLTGYYNLTANFNLDFAISNDSYTANSTIPEMEIALQTQFICSLEVTGATLNQYGYYPVYNLENQSISAVTFTTFAQNDILVSFWNQTQPANFDFNSGTPYLLNEGDMVSIKVSGNYKFDSITELGIYDFKPRIDFYQISPSDFKAELMDNQIHEGMNWNFNTGYISSDQCSDYILSIAKMFNLYFEFDTTEENTLVIEPRKEFYNGNIIDWTYKLDRSNESEIFPMSEITAKNLHFLYRSDSDYWNDKYQKENLSTNKYSLLSQMTYGEYTYYLDNDFVDQSSEDKIDLIFSPTPLVQDAFYTSITGGTYSSSTKVISTIYQQEYDNNSGNLVKKPLNSFAPRILFYNGLINCDQWGLYSNNEVVNKQIYASFLEANSGTTNSFTDYPHNILTQYPYVGHLDNPFTPTQDLNFTYPAEYFYARTGVTSSNLFNNYWFETVKDIEDKSAKLFTGYFRITVADIQALSFRNVIYMDSEYWIINQIIDYCPLDNSLTKVELIKLVNYNQTQNQISVVQQTINLEPTPTHKILPVGTNPRNNTTVGGINIQTLTPPSSNTILGTGNNISPASTGNLVIGNNNLIPSGLHGTVVIGSAIDSQNIKSNSINVGGLNLVGNEGTISYNGNPVLSISPTGLNIIGSSIQSINSIEAGRNEVLNEFSTATNINFISAGRDKIRGYGSATLVNFISAGRNTILVK